MKIIAEIGWNHMGDMNIAEQMISSASQSGADIVKFQYWDPCHLKPGEWDNDGRREIYNKACLSEDKINQLIGFSEKYDCEFLISVFGTRGAKFIFELGQTSIKIPSHETINTKLIEYCSQNFDHVYFSAGASTEEEIINAVEILKNGSASFTLMHCVSSYPCDDNKVNLKRLDWLGRLHSELGYSDHSSSKIIPSLSCMYGAKVIEKHFTIDNDLPGRDNKFAFEPHDFAVMVKNIHIAELALIDHGINYQDIESDTFHNYRGRWEPHDYE
jgi:N,N'-diacetyllegionaminate synthase